MAHVGLSFTVILTGRASVGAQTHAKKKPLLLAKSTGLSVRTGTKDVYVAMYRWTLEKLMKLHEFLSGSIPAQAFRCPPI